MPRTAPQMPARLAEAAFEQFADRGFAKVTLDQIAVAAGVTKGSLYCHYKSKYELILEAANHYYRTYQETVHAEMVPLSSPLARLARLLEVSVHRCVVDSRNRLFTAEIFAMSLKDERVREGWRQFYETVRELYVGLVVEANAAGELSVDDPKKAVDFMLSSLEGVKMRAAFEPHIADPREQQSLVEGLLGMLEVKCISLVGVFEQV